MSEYVYVVGSSADRRVKIGRSITPAYRLTRLQAGAPFPLKVLWQHPGDAALETALHREFRRHRVYGEWFDFDDYDPVALVTEAVNRLNPSLASIRARRARIREEQSHAWVEMLTDSIEEPNSSSRVKSLSAFLQDRQLRNGPSA